MKTCFAIVLLAASSISAGELQIKLSDRYAEVVGKPEDVDRFFHSWQTELWPEWRVSTNDGARKQYEAALPAIKEGRLALSTADKMCNAAFWNQLKAWPGDWTVHRETRD